LITGLAQGTCPECYKLYEFSLFPRFGFMGDTGNISPVFEQSGFAQLRFASFTFFTVSREKSIKM
jgi:hypothetical protein